MTHISASSRRVVLMVLAALLCTAVLSVPAARACIMDAAGLVMNNGELPGGG